MLKIFTKLFGTKFDRDVKKYTPVVDETIRVYETLQTLSSDELRDKHINLKQESKIILLESTKTFVSYMKK